MSKIWYNLITPENPDGERWASCYQINSGDTVYDNGVAHTANVSYKTNDAVADLVLSPKNPAG